MVLETSGLYKTYGNVHALRGIDLCVPEGSVFALLGENGLGKTTLLKCVLNVIEPTRGTARILGVDSRRVSPAVLAQIGYVSENQLFPAQLRVHEFFSYLRPCYPHWDRGLEEALRTQLRLPAERRIGARSHGMRLKLALATALPFKPRLLILDEPFSGLDPLVREELIDGFIRRRGQLSVVISSHELDEVERLGTHAAFLHSGRPLFLGSLPELRAHASSKLRNRQAGQAHLDPDYRPYIPAPTDVLNLYGIAVPVRDSEIYYAVDPAQLSRSYLLIKTFIVREHFTRSAVLRHVRLTD